jgi:aspartate racemase
MQLSDTKNIIGIVGGLGPLAGVLLQKYIIEATPANRDQDHFSVITYTNPQIPDRTTSLLGPKKGLDFAEEIIKTIGILEQAGASIIGIPCNTAHARYEIIQNACNIPVVNMVKEVVRLFDTENGSNIGLLATDGTIASDVYQKSSLNTKWIIPNKLEQALVMDTIYSIKAGRKPHIEAIINICNNLLFRGADRIILGCTELSIIQDALIKAKLPLLDSLRILAKILINQTAQQATTSKIFTQKTLQVAT